MEATNPILILNNAIIVTMDSHDRVFVDGAIVIQHNSIIAIGKSINILTQFTSISHQLIDLRGQILLPGLINTHVHTSQQLARGIADDVDLLTWLHDRIWPYESNMTEEDSFISTLLCGIELIHSGVTCFAEAGGQHVSGMASAVEVLGLRACLAESIMDYGEGLPASWAARTTDECIKSQKDLFMKHHNKADGRIKVWLGIRQIMNSTDRLLTETRDTAKELETGIHMHIAEIPYENQLIVETRGVDNGTVTYLEKIKFLQNNLLAAHTVWVNEKEVDCLAKAGVKVSHCPAAAMRMLGFAPIKKMLSAGVCVSLGTDGAPSNNRMSIVDEMYLASLINKGREVFSTGTTDPTALPAETILRMATINGAKSVLWDKEIGSLEVGKKADIVVVNPSSWSMMPIHDCISSLVYCMRTENIVSVMCNGCWIMKDKKILTVDEEEVLSMAKHASAELLKRAGIQIPNRMNFVDCIAKAGVKVSHCPAAAMRMVGFAPIKEMLSAGVCVSLGTDGAPSNNRMSIVDEMYLASLINKGREVFSTGTTDPTALPAETILRMATINGAKSVLWDKEIGSLEVGKKADIVVINPFSWSMMPIHDCISSLVYCMRTENIVSVMCNGCWIMKDKKILTVDEEKVLSMAKHASAELLKRAGIQIPNRMNFV